MFDNKYSKDNVLGFVLSLASHIDLNDLEYKSNRKPNPNASRIKVNRCPRKLKKAIKATFKDETKSSFISNLIDRYNIKENLKEFIQEMNWRHSGEFSMRKGRILF